MKTRHARDNECLRVCKRLMMMASLRVLVLESHNSQRMALINMMRRLGVGEVLAASNNEQALNLIQCTGGVDIVLCDLSDKGSEQLEFLRYASQIGLVQAVGLSKQLRPELSRALGRLEFLSGVQLLGILNTPLQPQAVERLLQGYRSMPPAALKTPAMAPLPSEDEIQRGLGLGEFRGWFQPKRMMKDGSIAGVEALARWEHPVRGVLLPKDFLAAVLAYDLIDEMFKQLLEQGLKLLAVLHRQGTVLEISFNLHASQLARHGLIEHIQGALQRHGLCASALVFELAENGLLDMQSPIPENLLRLRLMGCGLSIDDFGVGFSSLKLLCQLPFNQIKLDGDFIRTLNEPRSQAMVGSTLALARSLDMSLVIVGVSDRHIRDTLISLGCEVGQGFFLARPMTGHDLLLWLAQESARSLSSPEG